MLIAFIGSHGTGKTTTCYALKKQLGKDWLVFEDSYRKITHQLGYSRPKEALLQEQNKHIACTAMTAAAFGCLMEWNSGLKDSGMIDVGPPSLLAYHRYWMKICDTPVSSFLLKLCRQLSDQVDYYVYLPANAIPLVEDNMRSDDPIFQKDIDQWVLRNLEELCVPEEKIITPRSLHVEDRVNEIQDKIQCCQS